MPFRVSFFHQVQQAKLGGWSENYWSSHTDLERAQNSALALRPLLGQLHGSQVVQPSIRISDISTFRDVLLITVNTEPGSDVGVSAAVDYVTTAILLKLRSAGNYTVRQWIRGIKDNMVRLGGLYSPVAADVTRMFTFLRHLESAQNGWTMRVLDRAVPKKVVAAATSAGILTVRAHGYAADSLVRVSRGKGLTEINGLWRVTVVDPDTLQLQGFVVPPLPAPYRGGATVRLQQYRLEPIQTASIVRATSHKTGRPFGLLGGRRTRSKK